MKTAAEINVIDKDDDQSDSSSFESLPCTNPHLETVGKSCMNNHNELINQNHNHEINIKTDELIENLSSDDKKMSSNIINDICMDDDGSNSNEYKISQNDKENCQEIANSDTNNDKIELIESIDTKETKELLPENHLINEITNESIDLTQIDTEVASINENPLTDSIETNESQTNKVYSPSEDTLEKLEMCEKKRSKKKSNSFRNNASINCNNNVPVTSVFPTNSVVVSQKYTPSRENNRQHCRSVRKNFSLWIGVTSCVWGILLYLMKNYGDQ